MQVDTYLDELAAERQRYRSNQVLHAFNSAEPRRAATLLRQLLGSVGEGARVDPPFRCLHGSGIQLGDDVIIGTDCLLADSGDIVIGPRSFLGPRVVIYAGYHPDRSGSSDVRIGADVTIGAGAIICPGITIGDGATIAAGSVVTRDVPDGAFAYGNPSAIQKTFNTDPDS